MTHHDDRRFHLHVGRLEDEHADHRGLRDEEREDDAAVDLGPEEAARLVARRARASTKREERFVRESDRRTESGSQVDRESYVVR